MRALVALVAAVVTASCGGDSSMCGEPLSCDDFASEPGYSAGTMDAVPDDFPAAPAGATLCGQADGPTVYFLTDNAAAVHDYYRDALTAAGWTVAGPVSSAGSADAGPDCETEQAFTTGDPLVLVHVYPTRAAFSLALRNLDQ